MQKKYWTQSNINYNLKKLWENQEYKEITFLMNIYQNPTANTILNGEKVKAFPLGLGKIQGCQLLPSPFNILLEVLGGTIRQENKRPPEWKGNNHRWHYLYRENPKESTETKLKLVSLFVQYYVTI